MIFRSQQFQGKVATLNRYGGKLKITVDGLYS